MVTGEVADLVEADRGDIRLPLNPSPTTREKYIHNSRRLWIKPGSWITLLPRKGGNMNIYVGNLSFEVPERCLLLEDKGKL